MITDDTRDDRTPNEMPHRYFQLKVETLLEVLNHDLDSIESELRAARSIRANGSDDDEHDPDGIPLSTVIQQFEAQKVRVLGEIRDAEFASTDLARGDYGRCSICGRQIAVARLEIKPATRTCVTCAH